MKIKHYIIRNLINIDNDSAKKSISSSIEPATLSKLIQSKNKDDGSKRIVILGEAGSGKSTELFHNALQLYQNKDRDNVPVFIPLNTYTGDNFKEYASAKLGQDADFLLSYDKSKLVFFLDEFDQVLKKESATRQIQTFVDLYREAMFIISCRSNFYTNQFPEFDKYFLSLFDEDDITELSKAEMPTSYKQFVAQLHSVKIKEMARIPFFLNYLINLFNEDNSITDYSQTDVLEMVINHRLYNDLSKLSEFDLPNRYPLASIKKDLILISMILEILQSNHIDADELNNIIRSDFRSDVIKRLSLINRSYVNGKEVYQFLHNNINEYLAAKSLYDQDFEQIIDFLSVKAPLIKLNKGSEFLKLLKYFNLEVYGLKVSDLIYDLIGKKKKIGINPSWVNTLGFLIQLRKNRDLINYLVKHEPDIALKIELSRLTEDDKYTIFESIFNDYIDKKITIQDEIFSKLVEIISTSTKRKPDIYNYLMKYTAKGEHRNHRYNALNLLCYVKGDYNKQIIETIINRINDPDETNRVKHICILSLVELGATGKDIIDRIIVVSDTDSDYTLSGLYYLLYNSPDIDRYIDMLIAGIPKSKIDQSSRGIRLVDERFYLTKCLEKISSPSALNAIIDYISTSSNMFYDHDIKQLIPFIVKNLIKAYSTDNTVYKYAKTLLLAAEKGHSDELNKVGHFFITTDNALAIFEELLDEGFDKHYDALAVVINDDTLRLLVEKYSQGIISEENVLIYIRHISFRNYHKYQESLDFINSKTNNRFVPEPSIDYKALDRERLLRKVEIIFSKDEFIKELKSIFELSKKDTIKYQDSIDLEHENIHQNRAKYNSFVIDEIQKNVLIEDLKKEWSLESLIDKVNTFKYDIFTFDNIFKLLHDGVEIELNKSQITFIKDYCMSNLNRVNFKTALSVERKGEENSLTTSANGMAVRIWFIKRRFNLELPKQMLLDMLSFDWIETDGYCGINYLLNELEDEQAGKIVQENLEAGIAIAPVLINHIEFCLNNNLNSAIDDIYTSMNGEFIDNHEKKKMMELLIQFNGGREYIKKYLKSDDTELYLKAAKLLGDSEDAIEIIQERLNDSNIDISVESAKLLIPYQDINAIKLYVNHIVTSKKFNEDIHSSIGKIDSIDALKYLSKLLLFYFENHRELEENHSYLHMEIMQALKNIARKDYRNLRKVDHILKKFIRTHENKWGFVVHLNRYRDEIENEYYANYKEVKNLEEAISKVKSFPFISS